MTDSLYPPSPILADTRILEPSSEFKSKSTRVIIGIILFIALYVALIAGSAALLVGMGFLAVMLLGLYINWLTIVAALGMFGLGVMFFFFTIKFIFASTKEEEPVQLQITKQDHPLLFEFIGKLSKEVGTKFPRNIFLTPEVNAMVSYNSSFWSMFLPVRKNLRIGLGLVNTLNISEFKATVAHEFGHFSQRSMKSGSYVYTMNKVIYNLVFQRDRYDQILEEWASAGNTLSVFAMLTSACVDGVRSILRTSYNQLNISYMALSREMEYHADLVACSAAGNDAMVNTLRKIEFADVAYQQALQSLGGVAHSKKKKARDIYAFHSMIMASLASSNKLEMKNGMPVITLADIENSTPVQTRLVMKDQWASHPSREEREQSINRFEMKSPIIEESAWSLFTNPARVKEAMTSMVYEGGDEAAQLAELTAVEMDEYIVTENARVSISPTFHGLYDNRWVTKFDPEKISTWDADKSFGQVINQEAGHLVKSHQRDAADLERLNLIDQKAIRVDFFEYDLIRYKAREARTIMRQLEIEMKKSSKAIEELDFDIFRYYHGRANESGQTAEFLKLYKDLFAKRTDFDVADDFISRLQSMLDEMSSRRQWREDHVADLCRRSSDLEKQVKRFMSKLPGELVEVHFPEPTNVFKYLKTDTLWNQSMMEFSQQGFAQLQEYVACSINAARDLLWDATRAIYDKQLSLTSPEFLRK